MYGTIRKANQQFEIISIKLCGIENATINDVEYIDDSIVNVAGKGDFQRVLWSNPQYINFVAKVI